MSQAQDYSNLKISKEVHQLTAVTAAVQGETIKEFVEKALRARIEQHRIPVNAAFAKMFSADSSGKK